jgi:outer membrane lipoprotein-sorting protein
MLSRSAPIKRLLGCALACSFAAAWPPRLAAAQPTPQTLLAQVQRAYADGGDFEARFTQTHLDALSGRSRQESGQMWVKADGRVRFAYRAPEPKDFVFDGNTAYFYEPQNAQVTIFEHFADSPAAQAMQFLWGQGSLTQLFDVATCTPPTAEVPEVCPEVGPHEQAVQLRPRQQLPTVEHVALVIDTQAHRVRRSVVYDPLHNQTRYAFEELRFVAPLAANRFAFTIPSGVSVLRAPPAASGAGG